MADLAPARGSPAAEETTAWRRTNRAANPDEAPFGPMAPVLREAAWDAVATVHAGVVRRGRRPGPTVVELRVAAAGDAGNHITGDPVGHLLA